MAPDPRDIVDIPGLERGGTNGAPAPRSSGAREARPFLSIYFRCCHAYARVYRNSDRSAYEGACPRCGARVRAPIGPGGVSGRMFEAG